MDWLNSFRARLTALLAGFVLSLAIGVTLYLGEVATRHVTHTSGSALESIAKALANTLADTLVEREREIRLLSQSPLLIRGELDSPDVRQRLQQFKDSYRHYAWMGVTDATGQVVAAADQLLVGESVSQRPWFIHGRQQLYIGDVHEAVLLAKKLTQPNTNEPLRFVDFAAPIYAEQTQQLRGVVATHAHWSWAGEVLRATLPVESEQVGIEAFILNQRGEILYPYASIGQVQLPTQLPSNPHYAKLTWGQQGQFLSAYYPVKAHTHTDLGWQVLVRQPVTQALAEVTQLHRRLWLWGSLVCGLFIVLAYQLAMAVSRPIEQLASIARQVQQGQTEGIAFNVASSLREVRLLAHTLTSMTTTLIAREQALEHANATLEQQVQVRTAELQAANQELNQLARQDALTGLHNRLAAMEYLRAEFLRLKRVAQPYSVLLIDIDYFKRVNDNYGHEVGDQVLQRVAKLLQATVRVTDVVARLGGEEFLLILPATELVGAQVIAEKVRAAVADATIAVVEQVTISIGVAQAQINDANEDQAVRVADQRLYVAKAQGRNRVVSAHGLS